MTMDAVISASDSYVLLLRVQQKGSSLSVSHIAQACLVLTKQKIVARSNIILGAHGKWTRGLKITRYPTQMKSTVDCWLPHGPQNTFFFTTLK